MQAQDCATAHGHGLLVQVMDPQPLVARQAIEVLRPIRKPGQSSESLVGRAQGFDRAWHRRSSDH